MKFSRATKQTIKFRWRSRTDSPDGVTDIATLVITTCLGGGMHCPNASRCDIISECKNSLREMPSTVFYTLVKELQ